MMSQFDHVKFKYGKNKCFNNFERLKTYKICKFGSYIFLLFCILIKFLGHIGHATFEHDNKTLK